MPEPRESGDDAFILEFKVQSEDEKSLSDTVQKALRQIEEKNFQANLIANGFPEGQIIKAEMLNAEKGIGISPRNTS